MKPIFQIKPAHNSQPHESVLSIRIGDKHLGFAISDAAGDKLYGLSFYSAEEVTGGLIEEVLRENAGLKQNFIKVLISYDYQQNVLLPTGEYSDADALLVLQQMHGVNGQSVTKSEVVPGWQLQNMFAIPREVYDVMIAQFPNAIYRHHHTIGVRAARLTDKEHLMLLDLRRDEFSLILIHRNQLLLAQTYLYITPADVLYILLNVCQQHGISQELLQLELSGLIEKDSSLYREIHQYFLDVNFRSPSWGDDSSHDQSYPPHFFTSFNDLVLCE